MRLKIKLIFLFLLTFFLGFNFSFVKGAFAANYSLSGAVQDSSGVAVGNATVHVYNPGTSTDVVTPVSTDGTTGNYLFSSVPEGTYDIKVVPPIGSNYSSAIALGQVISANTILNFILTPSDTVYLKGHIYGPLGNPIPNQSVLLRTNGGTTISTRTDSNGFYSLQSSPQTFAFLRIIGTNNDLSLSIPEDYQINISSYALTQSTILDIKIPAKRVIVHTQDSSNTSVSNVQVTTSPWPASINDTTGLSIGGNITNATGGSSYDPGSSTLPSTDMYGNATLWLFPNSGSGSYTFTATPPTGSNFVTTTYSSSIISDTTVNITMKVPVKLYGHIFDPLGTPVGNQTVLLRTSAGSSLSGTSDSTGYFELHIAPDTYPSLRFIGSNNPTTVNLPQAYSIIVNNYTISQDTDLEITIPAKKVTTHVQDSLNNAISGVELTSAPTTGTSNNGTLSIGGGITNATGTSSYSSPGPTTNLSGNVIQWLLPNNSTLTYTFTAKPPTGSGYTTTTVPNVSVTADMPQTITLPKPVTLSGHIYDPLGFIVGNQTVLLRTSSGTVLSANTNFSGFYSISANADTYSSLRILGNNNAGLNVPEDYQLNVSNYVLSQTTTLDITVPARKVIVHVQNAVGDSVSGIQITTSPWPAGIFDNSGLSIGGGITNATGGSSYDPVTNGSTPTPPTTDSSGNATLWLFPNSGSNTYTFNLTPPTGSIYQQFTLSNIPITNDPVQNELVALQYNHATPITTAVLSPTPNGQGQYTDPTTVTLSATAATGYSIAHTYYTLDGGSQQTYTAPFTVAGNGSHVITYWSVDNSGVPENPNTKTFNILTTYSLSGTVYNDANQNGFQDSGETGVSGVAIGLTSGQFSTSTTTDSNGAYTFTDLVPGTYTETLTVPSGDVATTTNPATISLSSNTTQNFGVAPAGPTLVTAINAGGDTQGAYVADTDYTDGNPYTSSAPVDTTGVDNAAPQVVYQTVRFGNSFSYTIPGLTPNGTYTVRLHFNELYWGTTLAGNSGGVGSRVFNVAVNGTQVLSNYDIYDKAGGANIATTEQFPATPDTNGNVTISFSTVTDNAMVNGIEVYSGTLPSPTPTPTPTPATSAIINAGGSTVGSFQADNSYSGGSTYTSSSAVDTSNVTNPAPESVYQSVRYGNFTYNIQHLVPNQNFLVRLHFNELYWTSAGSRVFNVAINGSQVLSNYDIFQDAGGANIAVVKDFVKSSDSTGKMNITFTSVTDNAMVNGIEIIPATVPQPTYFTANNGTDFARLTSPFVSGVATQAVNADSSIALNVTNTSTYADSGFVLYEGTLGNLPNFTTIGTGDQYGLNLWFDTNNNNEYFAWDSNGILTGLNGETYALSNGSQNGAENVNGNTNFFLMSDGQSYSLADLKAGLAPGINANTKVAVWIGVNTANGSTSSTIQSVNGL